MSVRRFTLLMTVLATVIFVLFTMATARLLSGEQIDATTNKLFTLSEGTYSVLTNLSEPVELTFYYSEDVGIDYPAIRAHAARVTEMLKTYELVSGGDVELTIVNPLPFSQAEEDALQSGLSAIRTDGPDPLYFGLIGRNSVDTMEVIEFFRPEQDASLEYDLTRLVARLEDPEPPTIGIISALPGLSGTGEGAGDFAILSELSQSYGIDQIGTNFWFIPDDVDVLMVVHAPDLSEFQMYLIDQFVMRQGRLLLAIDPAMREAGGGSLIDEVVPPTSEAETLLRRWGLNVPDEVALDFETALPVSVAQTGGRSWVERQPLFPAPVGNTISDADPSTRELARPVNFGATGWIQKTADIEGTQFTPLIQSSDETGRIDRRAAQRRLDPADVLALFEPNSPALTFAGRLTGRLPSAFGDEAIQPNLPEDPTLARIAEASMTNRPHVRESEQGANIVIIADADLFADGFYINPQTGAAVADNAAFILNVIETLSGNIDLSALRSRAPAARPMLRVEAMRDAAQAKLSEEQERLEAELASTEARMRALQSGDGDELAQGQTDLGRLEELDRFRERLLNIRSDLRDIEKAFRSDIDGLEMRLRWITIWLPPIIVVLVGIGIFVWQKRRERTV